MDLSDCSLVHGLALDQGISSRIRKLLLLGGGGSCHTCLHREDLEPSKAITAEPALAYFEEMANFKRPRAVSK